mgnify:CR=1 FL=1
MDQVTFFWHRRDLRREDNHGLFRALSHHKNVLPLFIFDTNILEKLPADDARVGFIHKELERLKQEYQKLGGDLLVRIGKPEEVWHDLMSQYHIEAVYTNRDYEPYAQERDKRIFNLLQSQNIPFKGFKDHVIFEKSEVIKADGDPYSVFTPYSRRWRERLNDHPAELYDSASFTDGFYQTSSDLPSLKTVGFEPSDISIPERTVSDKILDAYKSKRNFPGTEGTSRLGIHLRFGTISIRSLLNRSAPHSSTYVNELIWRDFYQMVLFHFPHTVDKAFRPAYDNIEWRNDPDEFEAWCNGQTGYPIIDAGLRELNTTGYMHNRVRMIVASFLTKHLLIDWRWGERYFAEKLLDFELASNVGGWQWAAGSGTDAAPYFRVFNPTLQMDKFDKQRTYIQNWVPEFKSDKYPDPIVEHKIARERALATYKAGLNKT